LEQLAVAADAGGTALTLLQNGSPLAALSSAGCIETDAALALQPVIL